MKAQKARPANPMKKALNGKPHDGKTIMVASPTCGAKTRSGSPCRQIAGYKTDHVGQGRCNLHGGATPVIHGRYSSIERTRIKDLIELHVNDPDPLDTFPELAAARALFQDFIERYEKNSEALLAWHASWQVTNRLPEDRLMAFEAVVDEWEDQVKQMGDEATEKQSADVDAAREFIRFLRGNAATEKPRQLLDISDAVGHLREITKIVERKEKTRARNAISYEQLKRFLFGISRVIETRVTDPQLLSQLQSDILAVNV
jgi:hypothetical protein